MNEIDGAYAGYFERRDLIALLEHLLAELRAAALANGPVASAYPTTPGRAQLQEVSTACAKFCAMLDHQIMDLDATPGTTIGTLVSEVLTADGLRAQLTRLTQHHDGLAETLRESLPRIEDDFLHAHLKAMLDQQETGATLCRALIATLP